ncbi:hypothetical protein M231_06303 [Tremella mesenterica]|uniref:mRNA 3'-end-processing protein RNA14 n=1 Tax=Tremella mesenterica TaxID=5217 RepID=A0A4Q1BCB9_TREME|nr:uncharacterized protein TREMEDRAFT_73949 [Tremella mesenterica DSM 1558]EIW69695.1 hypothetical protein TREMEDRAFT_73949 [Tremella mesenterica DSM 1558]RXK36459.1 hypothetical protein M231_06303 [Tremella mesenterica]
MNDPSLVTQDVDPIEIVHEIQVLTDVETELANAALKAAQAPAFSGEIAEEAETVEQSLENAISETKEHVDTVDIALPIGSNGEISTSAISSVRDSASQHASASASATEPLDQVTPDVTMSHEPSDPARDLKDTLATVTAEITVPVLSDEVILPSDQVSNEEIAVESTEPVIQVEVPSSDTIESHVPAVQVVSEHVVPSSPAPAIQTVAPVVSIVTETTSAVIAPVLPQPIVSAAPVVPFPQGLSENSSSVVANPKWIQQWRHAPKDPYIILALFSWAIQRGEINDARAWFSLLYADNPSAYQPLLVLIQMELDLSNFPQVEELFAKALKGPSGEITSAADVSIWKSYLHYIRRQNPITEGSPTADQTRETVRKAYEFALKECGHDRESGELWQEYIHFLGEANPKNTWETQQQMDRLRAVYQRAICIPLNNLESLWKAYDAFESGINKAASKKFLQEHSPAYMTARTALRELKNLVDPIPHPPIPPHPTFSDEDRSAVSQWKAYLKWEESNPLVIEDPTKLDERISYAIRKCLGAMRHFPELWFQAAEYYVAQEKKDQVVEVLKAGVEACPKSFLLTFALADLEEDRGNVTGAGAAYEELISKLGEELEVLVRDVEDEVEGAKGPAVENGEEGKEEREKRGKEVEERRKGEVEEKTVALGVVWVMYMRHARRASGIKAARGVFGKARKSSHATWHVYEASAMMEYHSNKDSSVAIRIFELGLKLFAEDGDYVVKYLQFLLSINDDTNARALFERSALKIPAEKARPLWDAWARYEYMYADLAAVQKLEARFAEVFPNDSPLKRFAQRFTYSSLDEIATQDLGFRRILSQSQSQPQPQPHSTLPPPPQQTQQSQTFETQPTQLPPNPVPAHPSLPPNPTLPPYPTSNLPLQPIHFSPPQKRPAPESPPRRPRSPQPRRNSRDYSQPNEEPLHKRARPQNRYPSMNERTKERSPMLPVPPAPYRDRGDRAPSGVAPMYPSQGLREGYDRSGLSRPLAGFFGSLPNARYFDGPIFRPDDIIGLFNNVDMRGNGIPPSAPLPATYGGRGYDRPDLRYPPAPPPPTYGGRRY